MVLFQHLEDKSESGWIGRVSPVHFLTLEWKEIPQNVVKHTISYSFLFIFILTLT